MILIVFILKATVAVVVNYNHFMFMAQATVATVVNYDHFMFIVLAKALFQLKFLLNE